MASRFNGGAGVIGTWAMKRTQKLTRIPFFFLFFFYTHVLIFFLLPHLWEEIYYLFRAWYSVMWIRQSERRRIMNRFFVEELVDLSRGVISEERV
jgi:hypothetical protein